MSALVTISAAGAAGEQRRLVDQVGEIGAREAGCAARDRTEIDRRVHVDLAGVDAKDRLAAPEVRVAHGDLAIEPAGAEQRRIEDVLAVGRGDDDDALVTLEAVHLDEQLVERLLALFVAERVAAAAAADGVELVDEDDAGAVAACASRNSLRTRDAPTPAYISTKSEPLANRNGTPASPAIERASSVLPVPGGPTSRTPFGIRPPTRRIAPARAGSRRFP